MDGKTKAKAAIAYFSRHHGNTKKLLDAIKDSADIELIDVVEHDKADLTGYGIIGFASGTYFGKFNKRVVEFARNNLPSNKQVFLINTYGLRAANTKEMEQIINERSGRLLGTYGCRGYDTFGPLKMIGGIAKGHPDENEVKGAVEFFRKIMAGK
ncbi:MAG TPA: flavodoxin [Firmicutes bacterium]|nr:flavodoxin [Bacillota bacterium]